MIVFIMYSKYFDVLEKQIKMPINYASLIKESVYLTIRTFINQYLDKDQKYVCVSLSGGVDSMVIIACLNQLKSEYKFEVIGAHIEYANREESHKEAQFLRDWCNDNGIIFEIKQITEIKRDTMNREDYEEQSRQLRFQLYRELIKKYQIQGVILGHHAGDIAENVLTNVMHGRDLLDLQVIHATSQNQGINFWRPLVDLHKDSIFDLAHKYQVPYFKDSTPDWSNRGILRRKVFPQLENRYGINFKNKLVSIGHQSTEWSHLINDMIMTPFIKNNLMSGKWGCSIILDQYINAPKCFWAIVLRKVLHSMNMSMISGKSLNNLISSLKSKSESVRVNLGLDLICIIYQGKLFIRKKIFSAIIDQIIELDHKTVSTEIKLNNHMYYRITLKSKSKDGQSESQTKHLDYIQGIIRYNLDDCNKVLLSTTRNKMNSKVKELFRDLAPNHKDELPLITPYELIDISSDNYWEVELFMN